MGDQGDNGDTTGAADEGPAAQGTPRGCGIALVVAFLVVAGGVGSCVYLADTASQREANEREKFRD